MSTWSSGDNKSDEKSYLSIRSDDKISNEKSISIYMQKNANRSRALDPR